MRKLVVLQKGKQTASSPDRTLILMWAQVVDQEKRREHSYWINTPGERQAEILIAPSEEKADQALPLSKHELDA